VKEWDVKKVRQFKFSFDLKLWQEVNGNIAERMGMISNGKG